LLPVNLELFILRNFGFIRDDDGIVEVFFNKDNFTVFIEFVFLDFVGLFLVVTFLVAFAVIRGSSFLRENFISDASDCVILNLEFV